MMHRNSATMEGPFGVASELPQKFCWKLPTQFEGIINLRTVMWPVRRYNMIDFLYSSIFKLSIGKLCKNLC